ncbi:T9SS type A sorting domain-containing protein [Myroides odoratus]|uniref:T9SS type A sorting domain-containing protein n=1 Tax=Myroides odoratus TaxID=256 RepID=UPI0039B0D548
MKKILLVLFALCLNYFGFAQESELNGLFIRPSLQDAQTVGGGMNFNPDLNLSSGKTPLVYHNVLSKNYTLFYVYKEKKKVDSTAVAKKELPFLEMHFDGRIYKVTSSFFSGDKKFFIQANHRFNGTMVNHFGSFTPSKVGSKMRANFLFLFQRPSIELYEVVVFPSHLAALDYAKVHSYLSIKYSIPLPESFDYVDYYGNVLWEAKENKDYNSNLIGLGREDKFALKQYQSKAHLDDLLIVGFNDELQTHAQYTTKEIADNSYVLVGGNRGSLKFEKKKGQEYFNRKWKIVNHKTKGDLHFFFNRKAIEGSDDLKVEQDQSYDYYASISAKDNNALATLIPMEIKSDSLLYSRVPLNTTHNYVSIVRKQKVDFDVTYQVDCDAVAFKVNLRHGKLPFTLKIETQEGIKTLTSSTTTTSFNLPKDGVGKVELLVEDATGNKRRKELDVFDAFISPVTVESTYVLTQAGSIDIKPIGNIGNENRTLSKELKYQWYDAMHTLISTQETITLKNAGNFSLEVRDQNNTYCSSFKVLVGLEEKVDHQIGLYPNPVQKLEEFVVYIPLEKLQNAEVLVYTNKGQLLDYKMYRNTAQILYKHRIATTGMYIIVVKAGEQKQFYRLMVK